MDLDSLKYAELRSLAKTVGLKGNMKADKLLKALKQHYQQQQHEEEEGQVSSGAVVHAEDGNSAAQHVKQEETSATPSTQLFVTQRRGKGKKSKRNISEIEADCHHKSPPSEAKKDEVVVSAKRRRLSAVEDSAVTVPSEKSVDITSEQPPDVKIDISAVQENQPKTTKAGKIPRHEGLMKRTKLRPITPNFKKLHEAHFNKMESIDSYVERKTKQMENYKGSAQLKVRLEKTLSKPLDGVKIPAKANLNRASMFSPTPVDKKPAPERRRHTQVSASKPAQKEEVPFRPLVVSVRRINVRFSAATQDNEHKMSLVKTPARRSTSVALSTPGKRANDGAKASVGKTSFSSATKTPGVFVFNANTSINTPGTNKKPAFDLKASLSRPLSYKPHKGKLKPFAETKENSAANKSLQTSVISGSHQKNYKQHQVQTREARRAQHRDDRKQKKESVVGARRGLVMA